MIALLTAPQNAPFMAAGLLVFALGILEVLGLIAATSMSDLIDSLLPEFDADSPIGWLHLGKVPLLILLVVFLGCFAISGYALQSVAVATMGAYLPTIVASVAAFATAVFGVHVLGRPLARLVPTDETASVSEQSFIGRIAVITGGVSRPGLAAQAKLRDTHGRQHFVMVEPDLSADEFDQGDEVLIVAKAGPFYRCIANPHPGQL